MLASKPLLNSNYLSPHLVLTCSRKAAKSLSESLLHLWKVSFVDDYAFVAKGHCLKICNVHEYLDSRLRQCFHVFFLSFFFLATVDFFIKNISHDTIHTFKNYFITVFLVFNFQFSVFSKNKLYPNGHCCSKCRMMLQSPLLDFSNSFLLEEFWYIPSQHKVLDLCWDKWRVCFMVRIGMK